MITLCNVLSKGFDSNVRQRKKSPFSLSLSRFKPTNIIQYAWANYERIQSHLFAQCVQICFEYAQNTKFQCRKLAYTINKSEAIAWENARATSETTTMTTTVAAATTATRTFIGFIWTRVLVDFYYQLSKFYMDKWFKLHAFVVSVSATRIQLIRLTHKPFKIKNGITFSAFMAPLVEY